MSSGKIDHSELLRPVHRTSIRYYIVFAVAALGALAFMIGWSYQLSEGLIVTNLSDWGSGGGATWGLYIGAFIWWVGIAHGGIILSAAVRLLGMDLYKPVARLAELLTIGALSMAGTFIIVHVGRPDRLVWSVLLSYPWTVHTSPLVWDVTVITLYFVLTATYLALTLRYDIHRLRDQLPDHFEPIYKVLNIGYTEKEDEVVERVVWWLALAIIILAPLLLHGGVIPWLFALMPGMPGWFGGIQGPTFLTIALMSAMGGVIILASVFQLSYDWDRVISDEVIRGLTYWLGFFSLLFLWLQLQQIITGVYAAPLPELHATGGKLHTPAFWMAIGLVGMALAYVFAQALRPSVFSKSRSVVASIAVLGGTVTEKVLFVVEGFLHPVFDMYSAVPGEYVPSLVELSSLVGTISMSILFFLVVAKVIPVVELHAVEELNEELAEESEVEA